MTLKSTEWAQYSAVLGTQYNVFQLGWFPDYPDAENYLVPFYRSDTFTQSGYNSPKMEALIKKELGSQTLSQRLRVHQADPGPGREGRTDHPVLAAGDDRGRPQRRARDPEHARPEQLHAVLEAVEVVG